MYVYTARYRYANFQLHAVDTYLLSFSIQNIIMLGFSIILFFLVFFRKLKQKQQVYGIRSGHPRSQLMDGQPQRPPASPREMEVGCAIPLCLPNDLEWNPWTHKCTRVEGATRKFLVLNPQAVDILRSISGPVCVVAIVGPCRSGKSYILSHLISSKLGVKCHFDLGHEFDPKTKGIWMWDQPLKFTLNSGQEVTMVFLDTEGIDATNATEQGDKQIFTLSVLLSSLLIYNSMHVPRREDLNQMQYPYAGK